MRYTEEQNSINLSSHVPVKDSTQMSVKVCTKRKGKNSTTYKLLWEKANKQEFKRTFDCLVSTCNFEWDDNNVNSKIEKLTALLCKTADIVVPKKLIKLNGYN